MTTTTTNAEKLQENNAAVLSMKDLLDLVFDTVVLYSTGEIEFEPLHARCPRRSLRYAPSFVRGLRPIRGPVKPYVPAQVAKFLQRTVDVGRKNKKSDLSLKIVFDVLEAFQAHIITYAEIEEILNAPVRAQLKRVREFRRYR